MQPKVKKLKTLKISWKPTLTVKFVVKINPILMVKIVQTVPNSHLTIPLLHVWRWSAKILLCLSIIQQLINAHSVLTACNIQLHNRSVSKFNMWQTQTPFTFTFRKETTRKAAYNHKI